MKKIFIDGSSGTTGLRIKERLSYRKDIEIIELSEEKRKNEYSRYECLNNSDIAILCLPDEAAIQAVSFARNPDVVIIDTSTAHRVNPEFTYGFPEIAQNRQKISVSKRIANPGCHASGFISLVEPLIEYGLMSKDIQLSCFSLTGYSGGGKKMIREYESDKRDDLFDAPRLYATSQMHKHLPEMQKECGLVHAPVFCPVVEPFYAGMEVIVPLTSQDVSGGKKAVTELYKEYYRSGLVHYEENVDSFLSAGEFSGYDDMQITVCGNDERFTLISRFDNLGKGASGSAIQNLNIILGKDEKTGLNLKYKE